MLKSYLRKIFNFQNFYYRYHNCLSQITFGEVECDMIYCNWFGLILCVSWWINACCVFYTLHVYFGKMAYDLICFSLSFKMLYFIQLWCTTKSFVLLNPLDIQIFWYWVNKYNNHNSLHNNLFIFIEQLMQEKKANKK